MAEFKIKRNLGVIDNSPSLTSGGSFKIKRNLRLINTTEEPQQVEDTSGFGERFEPTGESLQDRDLIEDVTFQQAAKILYKMNNGRNALEEKPLESDEEYARYGIDMLGYFNYNLPKMTLDASRISGATMEQREAFLYMMDAYDELGLSWAGTGRFFKGVALDPTTIFGVTSFGLGFLVKEGAKGASKEGFKSFLRQSVKGGIVAGIESGVYAAADDINRQVVETSVTGEDIDLVRVGEKAAIGGTAGFILGGAITGVTKGVSSKLAKTKKTDSEKIDVEGFVKNIKEIDEIAKEASSPAGKSISAMNDVVKAIKNLAPDGKVIAVKEGTQNLDKLIKAVEPLQALISKAASKNPEDIADFMEKTTFTEGQKQALETVTLHTTTALKAQIVNLNREHNKLLGKIGKAKGNEKQILTKEAKNLEKNVNKIEEITEPIEKIYLASSTSVGRRLRAMQESINTGDLRGVLPKTLMKEKGLTKKAAKAEFDKLFLAKVSQFEGQTDIKKLKVKLETARQRGATTQFIKLKNELEVKREAFVKQEMMREGGLQSVIYDNVNKPVKVLNEVAISNVFSPPTVIINTVPSAVKMFYKPFLNNLMQRGLTRTSLKTMMAEYTAMLSIAPTALRSALAAFKYERSLLTGDSARFLEDYNTIPKKYGGGIVRIFPRLLLATDSFFENIHYRSYVVGKATGSAMENGIEKGLKGKDLDSFVKNKVEEAVKDAYEPKTNAIDVIVEDGKSRGLSGKKLNNYVKKELKNKSGLLQSATDKGGRDYVQDVLFKRDFSGKGAYSSLAKGYEGFVNRNPVMRMVGQLFFRTPVRVFEEGIRLTPGLNLIAPKFMADLTGKNGTMRQVRAQGEALMSYAIAGSVFSLYSTGNITGSKGSDYKQIRQGENAGTIEPYNIVFSDGSSFNYRNFDPFATPIKMIVNALERYEVLAYRAEQGERVNETAYQEAFKYVSIAMASILTSIRDANLASGIDSTIKLFEDIEDTENGFEQGIKFLGQKAQMFVPNTWYKAQLQVNPMLNDPKTFDQFLRQRINPSDPLVPKQYTALGRVRTLSNPRAALYYFDRVTEEERKRGVPEKELEVEEFLYRMTQVHDENFTAPYKQADYPFDLRTKITADGKETYYDRWQRYVRESNIVDTLHPFINSSLGTKSDNSKAGDKVREIINKFRKVAFIKLIREEQLQSVITKTKKRQLKSKAGLNEVFNIPFSN